MKTISKCEKKKNKDHEYERDRKQQEIIFTLYTRHKYTLKNTSNSFQKKKKKKNHQQQA